MDLIKNKYFHLFIILFGMAIMQSCQKEFIPSDLDAFDPDATFTQTVYRPYLGRTTLFSNNFNDLNSTKPLTFKIINMRRSNGDAAPELSALFPVTVWKMMYTGNETSIAEIEAKREQQERPVFEIREHSGEFIMWGSASSNFVQALPDSGYVFDVQVGNDGGSKVFTNLQLQPYRERDYEPNNADPVTGNASSDILNPTLLSNFVGDSTGINLSSNDVGITLHKINSTGNSFTIKFLDENYNPIDPANFNLTDWEHLLHGFNMRMDEEKVVYDVAYPIPLVNIQTRYTNQDGSMAHLVFAYDRIAFGGSRVVATLEFDFSIFTKGDWEMVVVFNREAPEFEND